MRTIALIGLLLASLALLPVLAQNDVPAFEPTTCLFELPPGVTEGESVRCGHVVVPEDRANPDSPTIRIAVAVFPATGPRPEPDPVFFLDGGPGAATLATLPFHGYRALVQPFVRQRDVIIFDQRGVGYSEPALNCAAFDRLAYDSLSMATRSGDAYDDTVRGLIGMCRAEFIDAGIDPDAYNTTNIAADVNAIRTALGYDQINLYGISYGTFLAQYVMRAYPATVRSVVLDSVLPVSVRALEEYPRNLERSFALLFSACAADRHCSTSYPDLEAVFYETVAQLDAQPVIVQGVPDVISGETYDVAVDGSRFIGLIFQQLYSTQAIPFLPRQIYGLHDDNSDVLFDTLIILVTAPQLAYEGMGVAVNCADIVPENEQAGIEAAVGVLQAPVLRTYFETLPLDSIPRFIETCGLWGSFDEDPQANLPVSSDIPTLIFAGEFDPITPPVWGQRVAESLPNSFFYEVPGHGHGVTVLSACPVNVMKAFLNEPTEAPNNACIPRQWVNFR